MSKNTLLSRRNFAKLIEQFDANELDGSAILSEYPGPNANLLNCMNTFGLWRSTFRNNLGVSTGTGTSKKTVVMASYLTSLTKTMSQGDNVCIVVLSAGERATRSNLIEDAGADDSDSVNPNVESLRQVLMWRIQDAKELYLKEMGEGLFETIARASSVNLYDLDAKARMEEIIGRVTSVHGKTVLCLSRIANALDIYCETSPAIEELDYSEETGPLIAVSLSDKDKTRVFIEGLLDAPNLLEKKMTLIGLSMAFNIGTAIAVRLPIEYVSGMARSLYQTDASGPDNERGVEAFFSSMLSRVGDYAVYGTTPYKHSLIVRGHDISHLSNVDYAEVQTKTLVRPRLLPMQHLEDYRGDWFTNAQTNLGPLLLASADRDTEPAGPALMKRREELAGVLHELYVSVWLLQNASLMYERSIEVLIGRPTSKPRISASPSRVAYCMYSACVNKVVQLIEANESVALLAFPSRFNVIYNDLDPRSVRWPLADLAESVYWEKGFVYVGLFPSYGYENIYPGYEACDSNQTEPRRTNLGECKKNLAALVYDYMLAYREALRDRAIRRSQDTGIPYSFNYTYKGRWLQESLPDDVAYFIDEAQPHHTRMTIAGRLALLQEVFSTNGTVAATIVKGLIQQEGSLLKFYVNLALMRSAFAAKNEKMGRIIHPTLYHSKQFYFPHLSGTGQDNEIFYHSSQSRPPHYEPGEFDSDFPDVFDLIIPVTARRPAEDMPAIREPRPKELEKGYGAACLVAEQMDYAVNGYVPYRMEIATLPSDSKAPYAYPPVRYAVPVLVPNVGFAEDTFLQALVENANRSDLSF